MYLAASFNLCLAWEREIHLKIYLALTSFICVEVAQTMGVVPGLSFTILVRVNLCRTLHFSLSALGMSYARLPFSMGKRSRGCGLSRHWGLLCASVLLLLSHVHRDGNVLSSAQG